jgi:hypothetical protein
LFGENKKRKEKKKKKKRKKRKENTRMRKGKRLPVSKDNKKETEKKRMKKFTKRKFSLQCQGAKVERGARLEDGNKELEDPYAGRRVLNFEQTLLHRRPRWRHVIGACP